MFYSSWARGLRSVKALPLILLKLHSAYMQILEQVPLLSREIATSFESDEPILLPDNFHVIHLELEPDCPQA